MKKWVDYSQKYGLGYMLSNGACGVYFNDSTKIILDPSGEMFDYLERRVSDKQEIIQTHSFTNYPTEIHKKVTLLQHFKSYLEGDGKKPINAPIKKENQFFKEDNATSSTRNQRNVSEIVYVKKWMRTKYAVMFRLSNKIVQVNFQDHTEIILSSETKMVTYVNKQGERKTYRLSQAIDSGDLEMQKRLKYTKDILTQMLSSGSPR